MKKLGLIVVALTAVLVSCGNAENPPSPPNVSHIYKITEYNSVYEFRSKADPTIVCIWIPNGYGTTLSCTKTNGSE